MFRLLASLLLALTLALSPLAMNGGIAMAHAGEGMTAAGHCSEAQAPTDHDDQSEDTLDCAGICSAVAAGQQSPLGYDPLPHRADMSALGALSGVPLERETPPPRISPEI